MTRPTRRTANATVSHSYSASDSPPQRVATRHRATIEHRGYHDMPPQQTTPSDCSTIAVDELESYANGHYNDAARHTPNGAAPSPRGVVYAPEPLESLKLVQPPNFCPVTTAPYHTTVDGYIIDHAESSDIPYRTATYVTYDATYPTYYQVSRLRNFCGYNRKEVVAVRFSGGFFATALKQPKTTKHQYFRKSFPIASASFPDFCLLI